MNNIKKRNNSIIIDNKIYVTSLKGKRPQNEDTEIIINNINGENKDIHNINIYGINDGHGGKKVSEYLKRVLPRFFLDKRVKFPITKDYIENVYEYLQNNIKKNCPESEFSGSTSLIVIHYKKNNEEYIQIINCGDSRCIINRNNIACPLTKDHKPDWPEERHRILKMGGKIEYDGYDWRINNLSVSRAVGDLDAKPEVSHIPEIFKYKITSDDKFIVLGCDGLYDVLSNSDIINYIILNCYDNTLENRINKDINISEKLAKYAIERGSTDNVSCIIIFLN